MNAWMYPLLGAALAVAITGWVYREHWMETLRRCARGVANLLLPLSVIAAELRRANELKELELSERINPKTGEINPIIVRTEMPGRNDTEVFFGEEPQLHGIAALREKLMKQWEDDGDE